MSMVHFVFEMELLIIAGNEQKIRKFRIIKAILIALLIIHAVIFDFSRVVWDFGRNLDTVGNIFMILTGLTKVISDVCTYYFFI